MKIYNTLPDGNEAADMEPAHYFNLAINQLNKSEEHLRNTDKAIQVMLVHIDILVYLSEKYPRMANLRLEKIKIQQWKGSFYSWYERCSSKIPVSYRQGIKDSADSLFEELLKYGH
ncbi:hypothetical protein [Fibrella aquatilis]|uniref:Uncharacterized protein n=1 Tax=Fibrella aquatilis TaxID=2817059 RepID=A0A939G974_9BACT|nr:hypothetical protein [Fibrella aquatilis]MBO0933305.1 hypothetical protein [Fibrella aquatilis]